MQIKRTIERVPGGLMVVPLFLGALLNTIDQMHIPFIMDILKSLGVAQFKPGIVNHYFMVLAIRTSRV